jgi:hypothetical protein
MTEKFYIALKRKFLEILEELWVRSQTEIRNTLLEAGGKEALAIK